MPESPPQPGRIPEPWNLENRTTYYFLQLGVGSFVPQQQMTDTSRELTRSRRVWPRPVELSFRSQCIAKAQRLREEISLKSNSPALAGAAQLVAASSRAPKGRGLDPWSGHVPRLQVQSPVGVRHGRQPIDVSLPLFLPSSLFKINKQGGPGIQSGPAGVTQRWRNGP